MKTMKCRHCGEEIILSELYGRPRYVAPGVRPGSGMTLCMNHNAYYHSPLTEEEIIDKILKKYVTLEDRFPLIRVCKSLFSGNSGKAS